MSILKEMITLVCNETLIENRQYEKVYEENIKLIYHVARKYTNLNLDFEDIVGHATVGFVEAMKKYDKNSNASFSTFACLCMRNRILIADRRLNQRKAERLSVHYEDCIHYDKEGNMLCAIDLISDDKIDIEKDYLQKETHEELWRAIQLLGKEEQEYVEYYMSGKRQMQIAELFNTSQTQVSRKLKKIFKKLKTYLEENTADRRKEMNKKNKEAPKVLADSKINNCSDLKLVRMLFESKDYIYEIKNKEKVYIMARDHSDKVFTLDVNLLEVLMHDLELIETLI